MTAAADFRPLSLCVLTVSDTRSADNDTSGAYLSDALRDAGHRLFERAIVRDDKYAMRALVSRWIADGEPWTASWSPVAPASPAAIPPRSAAAACSTSTCPASANCSARSASRRSAPRRCSRARSPGWPTQTFLFALPGSTSACRTGWDRIIAAQLDARTRPCNLANLKPRLKE
jgi:molybdenum cofactor biosynthesis protein B